MITSIHARFEGAAIVFNNTAAKDTGIWIFVTVLSGKTITLFIDHSDTIADVKKRISDKDGIPVHYMIITLNSSTLFDHYICSDCNIDRDTTLRVTSRLGGGAYDDYADEYDDQYNDNGFNNHAEANDDHQLQRSQGHRGQGQNARQRRQKDKRALQATGQPQSQSTGAATDLHALMLQPSEQCLVTKRIPEATPERSSITASTHSSNLAQGEAGTACTASRRPMV